MAFGQFSRKPGKEAGQEHENQAAAKPLVMVVDDDENMRYALKKNLETKYQVLACAGGEEAIQSVSEDVHVIILDIKMPGKDGFQVYQEVSSTYPDIPIIFYSAYQDVLEAAQLRKEYNPFNYFDKGEKVSHLLECVDRAVAMYANVRKIMQVEHRMKGHNKRP